MESCLAARAHNFRSWALPASFLFVAKEEEIMKKALSLVSILLLLVILGGCKEYKTTTCEACNKTTKCYKVTWVRQSDELEESHYVCSKKCEDDLDYIMHYIGGMNKK